MENGWKQIIETCEATGIKPTSRGLFVSVPRQTMQFFENGDLVKAYVVSTSKRPPCNEKGSLGTPPGLHSIAEKIGAGQPPGIVFKGRVATGYHFNEHLDRGGKDGNLITSRILWLKGLQAGLNQGPGVDSHDRYIYIHGTNHEELLGQPQSAGCVLMANIEIAELFEKVRPGDLVLMDAGEQA